MKYLDQQCASGEEVVRFCGVEAMTPETGHPAVISLRDYHMVVTGLRIEDGPMGVEAQEFGCLHVVRGCCRALSVPCSELLRGTQYGGPWRGDAPSRWPTHIFNPARQTLSFELAYARVPFNLRVFWKRLERFP
jgi:hypothetical protein